MTTANVRARAERVWITRTTVQEVTYQDIAVAQREGNAVLKALQARYRRSKGSYVAHLRFRVCIPDAINVAAFLSKYKT